MRTSRSTRSSSRTQTTDVDVAPSTIDLSRAENQLFSAIGREHALREVFQASAAEQYDFIIIDCPPTLGLLTINALVAADGVIIPVQTQYYALKGFTALMNVINQIITKALNPRPARAGSAADVLRRPDRCSVGTCSRRCATWATTTSSRT